ncbi:MAG: hypothetical protein AAFQ80_07725 [Cyanobacteria bacterium J06621_8]
MKFNLQQSTLGILFDKVSFDIGIPAEAILPLRILSILYREDFSRDLYRQLTDTELR